jgi:serine/threonine protein kinase
MLVWTFLKRHYQDAFLASPLFHKYCQFAYIAKVGCPLTSLPPSLPPSLQQPVTEHDFVLFRALGRGGFGQVNGCKRCQTGKLYAMKVMNKRRVKAHQSGAASASSLSPPNACL